MKGYGRAPAPQNYFIRIIKLCLFDVKINICSYHDFQINKN